MRARILLVAIVAVAGGLAMRQSAPRFNPVIDLLVAKKPVFGLYPPANPRVGGRGGRGGGRGGAGGATMDSAAAAAAAAAALAAQKTPLQLAQDALAYKSADLIFDGSMEGNFDTAYVRFAPFAKGMVDAGVVQKSPMRLLQPIFVKTPEIAPNAALAAERIGRQLNLGVAGIVFTSVESAEEVRAGLAAMRFKSNGGTRPDDVGNAPALWGMSEKEYKEKADLWPLNPKGELVNWTIVESKEGLAHIREIAAVKGIGVLFPGAGTLGGVFSTTDSTGRRVRDDVAWEAAIQQVLSACKEFNVPCGYPATERDIETRMKQGFSVFIISWGEAGFRAVDIGRRVGGR